MDLMIDIETLGTDPNSVILSIGAVKFDLTKEGIDPVPERQFYVNVDIQSCLNKGMTVSGSTLRWWFQPELASARESLLLGVPEPLADALNSLSTFVVAGDEIEQVWAKGPSFDLVILEDAYRRCQLPVPVPVPWRFYHHRDVRTIFDLADRVREDWRAEAPIAHNALADAIAQALDVQKAYQILFRR